MCDCCGKCLLILQRKTSVCDLTKATEEARDDRLRSLPSTLGDTALYHSDLSWGFAKLKGRLLWVAWKNQQTVDHLRDNHP